MIKKKYITQIIELIHPLDNLDWVIKDETTELIVNFNFKENEKTLDLTKFNNLKKLVIIDKFNKKQKTLCDWIGNIIKDKKNNLPLNLLNIISSSIIKLNCISSNISYIQNLPTTLTHLRCSSNNIMEIKYLPPTLEVLELSNCKLSNSNIRLNHFYLPKLEILKINSNNLCLSIRDFISPLDNLKIFECKNNKFDKFSNFELLEELVPNLEILKCSKNQLDNCSFTNLPSGLKILDCSYNLIENLDNLPILIEILDCSHNLIMNLDYLPSSIIRLNCSHNQIIQLDNLPNTIEYLIIISNPIIQLENLPSSIINLKIINCDKFINKIINPPQILEKITIINNNKETLNDYNFINLTNLPKIKSIIVKDYLSKEGIMTSNLIK
jgi:hypothetical protein